ncbi:MAG: nucleotide-binding protein [Alphaproteobacteria bacterium]|nr:nucleotide-binding protein [Alphaproteobacteria bacterium]
MKKIIEKLKELASDSIQLSNLFESHTKGTDIIEIFKERLKKLEKSHSRSWFGDHAYTYYTHFAPPPAGHSFDVEWGFVHGYGESHNPNWKVYTEEEIRSFVFQDIGEGFYDKLNSLANDVVIQISAIHDRSLDIIYLLATQDTLTSINRYKERLENTLTTYSPEDFVNSRYSKVPRVTRDSEEAAKGTIVPPHITYNSSLRSISENCDRLFKIAETLSAITEALSLSEPLPNEADLSKKIFIGHGRSEQWRILKDFLTTRLSLDFEEFNQVSPAGISTQERLAEMLSSCGFAFLVLTAEDLHGDGSVHARENVIHEVGLFQGKLGWRRAIVILEEECAEFSNVHGLGQVRFSKGNIASCFEEIRSVLEREEVIE